jgi:superfamily I DNA/RNA helicase
LDYLEKYTRSNSMDFTARQENIDQLIHAASQKETIADYLEEAALVREDKDEEEEIRRCQPLTVHGAKGLEFHTVFVIGCEEQLFPHWRSMDSDEDLEEERRLMYVAVTRAERCLFITTAIPQRPVQPPQPVSGRDRFGPGRRAGLRLGVRPCMDRQGPEPALFQKSLNEVDIIRSCVYF